MSNSKLCNVFHIDQYDADVISHAVTCTFTASGCLGYKVALMSFCSSVLYFLFIIYNIKGKGKETYSSLQGSPLRELTYHMGSHSVTCHPAEVTFPPLPQPKLVFDLATPGDARLS